jgi:hypothetical protein
VGLVETIAGLAVPQAAWPLRLLTWARGAATWLFAHPMTGVALLAAVFGAVEHHEADKWAALARQRSATIAAIQSANAAATQQATAAKEAKDAYNAKLAAQSDQTAADLRGGYHAAVLQLAAAQDNARGTDLPGHADAPESSDGPGERAGVSVGIDSGEPVDPVAISRDDALTCADNTARLQAVHDWAVALGQ